MAYIQPTGNSPRSMCQAGFPCFHRLVKHAPSSPPLSPKQKKHTPPVPTHQSKKNRPYGVAQLPPLGPAKKGA
jgi:hypothetical protein